MGSNTLLGQVLFMQTGEMRLSEAVPGMQCTVVNVYDDFARLQAIRFGIAEGAQLVCQAVLSGGPIVVRKGKQEVAIGRRLAERIQVRQGGGVEADAQSRHG